MLGSVPNIEISTYMGCKRGKGSALPLFKKLFLLLLLILCPKSILPLCYRKEDHPYMLFLTEQWKNLLKKRFSLGVYLRCLLNSACFNSLHLQSAFPTILPPHSSAEWSCRAETSPYTYIGDNLLSLALSFSPKKLGTEAVLTAVSFLNRIPSSVISGLSLFERRLSTPPDYEELRG